MVAQHPHLASSPFSYCHIDEIDEMSKRWRVTVDWSGPQAALDHFMDRADTGLLQDGSELVVNPVEFQECSNAGAVNLLAIQIIQKSMLVAAFLSPGLSLRIKAIEDLAAGTPSAQYVFADAIDGLGISSFFYAEAYDAKGNKIPPARWPRHVLAQPVVSHALEILANLRKGDWAGLFKVIELIQDDRAPLAEWQMKTKLEKISHYANSPAAAGKGARHAVQKGSAPSKKMTYEEASNTVREAVYRWIDWKC